MNQTFLRSYGALTAVLAWVLAGSSAHGQILINEIMYHPPPAIPEAPSKEWIELYNRGTNAVDLSGWRFTKGISFTFTNVTLPAGGYLVVAANRAVFQTNYPTVTNLVGDWIGKLRNSGETLELSDARDQKMDTVTYATEGDWALRRPGEPYPGKPTWWLGWQWTTPADGLGKSMELINANLPNNYGQNWTASLPDGGTPGQPNSVATNHIAPMILEVQHLPAIPRATNTVNVSARILQEAGSTAFVSVFYRLAGASSFTSLPMLDDGLHGDGAANDAIYGTTLPAQPDKTIVEFYVQARDTDARTRTWPGSTDEAGTQNANALYQVDEFAYNGSQPIYRFIIKPSEWSAWLNLMDNVTGGQYSDAQMNATVVRLSGTGTETRYCASLRNRGAGTRAAHPHNLHLRIPADQPLQGLRALDFNTRTVHSQVAGNAIFSAAGLLNAYGTPVQVRINGANLANATPTPGVTDSFQFGSYYCFEPYDSDWASVHVPQDAGGNIYKGTWYLDGVQLVRGATLDYLGTNVALYKQSYAPSGPTSNTGPYSKQNNASEDDWSDLIRLTESLQTNTPDASYLQAIGPTVNIDQWLHYFAVNSLLINMETTLATGAGDDVSWYRGGLDPRFQILNHDQDTVLGQGDATPSYTRSIFKAAEISVLNRFLKHPTVAPRYFAILKQLAETTFAPASIQTLLEQNLAGWVPDSYIQSMKDTAERRRTNVLAQIPQTLSVQSSLTLSNGFPYSTAATTSLAGKANAILTQTILLNGTPATYVPWQGAWSASAIPLHPGLNRILIQALNTNGLEFDRTNFDLWFDSGPTQVVSGTIATNSTWTAAAGPYSVTNHLTVDSGVTLTIEPGTTVYLGSNVSFTVASGGRLLAEGTATAPIRFTVPPGSGLNWGGLTIQGDVGSPETRLAYTHFESNNTTCIAVDRGTLSLDHATFGTTTHQYLSLDGSSFLVSHCLFPSATTEFELVHGSGGIKTGGRGIVRDCLFGSPIGYNDVMDFTGGNRNANQPIIQYYNNVFTGATDDILDLDGTDAWIEGNIFLHVHKNNAPDSSSAISGGDNASDTSEITVVGNLFFDCDQAATAKQGNFYTLLNNTIVHVTQTGGEDTGSGVLNVRDFPDGGTPTTFGAGFYLEGNIIADAEQLVRNYDPAQTTVIFQNNLLPFDWTGPGSGNSTNNPLLKHIPQLSETQFTSWEQAQILRDWFSLRPGSPALGTGLNGRDMGGVIPLGAAISGEPVGTTAQSNATLFVGPLRSGNGIPAAGFPYGSGYTHYKWRLDDNSWSAETPTAAPITLTGLANGPHHVEVIGKRDSGWFQDAAELGEDALVTTSRTWTVNTALSGLRLNEILARNASTLLTNGESPDLVELYNAGLAPVDLSGKGLTDDPLSPFKYTFPAGTSLAPGKFLVLLADTAPAGTSATSSAYLGFGFNANGDSLYLFEAAAAGTGSTPSLIDSVSFGPQIPDYSLGRLDDGTWTLCQPTFGAANRLQFTGDISSLRLNEWLTAGSPALPDDFVELYNPEPVPVALGGLFLSDAPDGSPARHQLAPLSYIPAGGFLAFKADGNTSAGPEHLNFNLASEMGAIGLFAPDLSLIDRVLYGPQTLGVSQGRTPNGAATFGYFTVPTPGSGNPANVGSVRTVATTYTLIPLTNSWRYNPYGTNLPTAWKDTDYFDAAWPSGPALLGIEPSSPYPYANPILTPLRLTNAAGTFVTTLYFRTTFYVPTNLAGFTIDTGIYLDDGAVFYLNGSDAGRIRLPSGTITASTLATNQPSEGVRESLLIPASAFLPGSNTLAVEVHQTSSGSSDVLFGMSVIASRTLLVTNFNTVVLNEVLADNGSLTNADGTTADWVELYNPSSNSVSLAGFSLTDDVTQPRRWVFPAGVTVPAKGFLLVRCDSSLPASNTSGPLLNTGFGLNAAGDALYLFDISGSLFDSVTFGPQATDFSIARVPDGTPGWALALPTPDSANIAATTGDAANVRINEWAASVANGPDWFELFNPNPQPVALGGLYLTDKLGNRTKHLIAPLTFLGVATNAYLKFIADNDPVQGPNHVGFSLDADPGEALGLFPPGTAPAIDSVTFSLQTTGISEGRLPDGATSRVFFPHPSPGEANWLPLTSVLINEVLTHTDPPLEDAVELYNATDQEIDISNWYLSDSRRDLRKFRIPEGTVLPPHDYRVFYEYQFNPDLTQPQSFSFSSAKGDEVWLTAAGANGVLTGYRDYVKFGPQFNGVSFGRFATSVGPDFTALSALTLGTAVTAHSPTNQLSLFRTGGGSLNAYPRVGPVILSEIMYRPPPLGTNDNLQDEFIELHNITGVTVPLYDVAHPTNGWRLHDGVEFTFTTNHALPPGGFLLVVSFDPATNAAATAAFRTQYATDAVVVGPWSGKLANTGETIELQVPDTPQTTGADIGLVPYVTIERMTYSNSVPWPATADGSGLSLQRLSFTAYGNEPTNWVAAAPTPGSSGLADSDGDGLPDVWEDAQGLNKFVNDAAQDPDHDGFSNYQEYLAGTDPHSATSFLHLDSVVSATDGAQLRFTAMPGRTYSILYSDALPTGSWQKFLDVPAQPTAQTLVITDSAELSQFGRYYRLVTPAMP